MDALLDTAPNPLVPTMRESMEHALSPEEEGEFLRHLGAAFAEGRAIRRLDPRQQQALVTRKCPRDIGAPARQLEILKRLRQGASS